MPVPPMFCWSRFGTESGEELTAIIARKNLERSLNAGAFTWGIGSALGTAVDSLRLEAADPEVLFSPIASAAAAADVNPEFVVAWLAYVGPLGEHIALPPGALITSRAPHHGDLNLARHYALFARTDGPLSFAGSETLDIGQLTNLTTGTAIGSSQTTCVVRTRADFNAVRPYTIAQRAHLVEPYFARLADPILLAADDRDALSAITSDEAHHRFVAELRLRRTTTHVPLQSSLF